MNANELADLLEVDSWYKLVTREEIATMLRQQEVEIERITSKYEEILHEQQVEIEALKKELALWRLSKSSEEIEQVPTNPTLMGGLDEPVGHFYPEGEGATIYDIKFAWKVTGTTEPIPLYTHPAEHDLGIAEAIGFEKGYKAATAKTLTDEEINVVAILQDAEIVPVGHEIWKTGEEFNKYKKIVLATAKALRKAQEK